MENYEIVKKEEKKVNIKVRDNNYMIRSYEGVKIERKLDEIHEWRWYINGEEVEEGAKIYKEKDGNDKLREIFMNIIKKKK